MATVHNQSDFPDINNINTLNLQLLVEQIEKEKKAGGDQQAILLNLSKALQEVMDEVNSGANKSSDKIVHPNFKSSAETQAPANNPQIPSNASMQEAIGKLMGLLAELEGEIAKWGNEKSQLNAQVGQSMISELSSQVTAAQKQLQKVLDSENKSDFWSIFTKVAEVVVGVVIAVIACLLGQPELAAIVLVMTVLAVSGAMDDATKGLSSLLQDMGMSPEAANIVAAAIIIVASIVLTIVTCGAAAEVTAEVATNAVGEVAEDSIEMADMASETVEDTASETASETSSETTTETTQESQNASKWQQFKNALQKVVDNVKSGGQKVIDNTFGKLPKPVNLGIVAGSMAVGSTNFAQYLATIILSKMKDGKEKDDLTLLIEVIVNLLAAIAGAGAGMAAGSASSMYQLSNTALAVKGLSVVALAGGISAGSFQIKQGTIEDTLAGQTEVLGQIQALIVELQALNTMNSSQSAADTKTLSGQLKAHSEQLAALSADVVKEGQALTQVLQA